MGLRCWGINRREQTRSKTEGGRSDCGLRQPVRLCACTQVCNPNQAVEDRQRSFGPGAPFGHCSISVQAPVCRLLRNRLRATPALVLRISVRITDGSVASPPSANARVQAALRGSCRLAGFPNERSEREPQPKRRPTRTPSDHCDQVTKYTGREREVLRTFQPSTERMSRSPRPVRPP